MTRTLAIKRCMLAALTTTALLLAGCATVDRAPPTHQVNPFDGMHGQ